MKKILFFLILIINTSVYSYIDRSNAEIKILDKVSGKYITTILEKDKIISQTKLSFKLRTCKESDPFDPKNFYAFIEIYNKDKLIFSNWMDRNEPGDNPLQNADYDVWLVSCN